MKRWDSSVKTYTSLKVVIDYYKQNNRALDEHSRLLDERKKNDEESKSIIKIMQYENTLVGFTQLLERRHHRFLRLNELLLKTLKKELSKLSYEDPARTISILRSSSPTTPRRC